MINEVLEFIAKRSMEVMMGKNTDKVNAQLTANTNTNAFDLKIENTPFSMKMKHIGQVLTKQNLAFLMDTPMNFMISSINPNSAEFKVMWKKGDDVTVEIEPTSEFGEKFLKAFSKKEAEVIFSAKEIPQFENPNI